MNIVLIALFTFGAILNLFRFFTEGQDIDKLIIAILFFAITCYNVGDYFEAKVRR